ncbi:two-component response regulator-like APRR1 isoform X2 [Cicer arietinum]|uniref:Two-component response regulator-like APRR1 isoform X2 n=1 Tax=Cicer arietinum TaxID=3827 RepID=A0A1S2YRD7_CICAR|nr:two-component response regulator-like APRR1 isoform X2 [Cicer arietinum]
MDTEELIDLNSKESNFGGNNSKSGDGFIDRSKVRILLCDNDSKSSEEVFTLLVNCSYQVTCVRSARQVIDALNAEGQYIDIILAEVDLPIKKGMKMLKYVAHDKELRRIPIIMMSAQDEVSIVVKCLRLGAADYLVKPLRTNELLNLWTHMWRRRRMLGLTENNILNYDFDLVASDPSDANTNSTTLFSDDTDDKSKRSNNPEAEISIQQEQEASIATAAAVIEELPYTHVSEYQPDVPGISDRRTGSSGQHPPCNRVTDGPKKSELRIGESSAFFTYVKTTTTKNNFEESAHVDDSCTSQVRMEDINQACPQQGGNDLKRHNDGETISSHVPDDLPSSNSIPDSLSIERSCTPPASMEVSQQKNYKEEHQQGVVHPRNGGYGSRLNPPDMPTQHAYPYYMPGIVNHVMMPSSAQMYQKNIQDLQSHHVSSSMIAQYNHLPQCPPHATGMTPFPYYPMSICLQTGQVSTNHSWPSLGSSTSCEANISRVDRREAALMKFRRKRKERCFDKKIRYVNRKQLAERRPRVRGQFVRKMNGINVDLNGQPASTDYDDDDEEEEENNDPRDS